MSPQNDIKDIMRIRIAEFREKYLQISEDEFSEQTGIPVSRVKKIEAGQSRVKLSDMTAIMDAYSLSSDYLLGKSDIPKPIIMNEQMGKVWAAIEQLSPEELKKLIEMYDEKRKVTTICYGKEKVWESREEAEAFFLQAMASSEGSEQSRYAAVYTKLRMGMEVCNDDE